VNPSNIGRDFSGKFLEKSWNCPIFQEISRKKTKKQTKFGEKNAVFFSLGIVSLLEQIIIKFRVFQFANSFNSSQSS
jgi:hypothetical protein